MVQVVFQLRFLTGALLAAPPLQAMAVRDVTVGALAWLCATWQVYLLNGLCDRTEDRHNGSGRPLATGALPASAARTIATVLSAVAVALGALVSTGFAMLVVVMLALGWLYSAAPRPQKANLPGFVAVVVAGGLVTYLAGWHAAGGGVPDPRMLAVALALSFWMGLVGMTKDLPDVAGDRLAGRHTLPIVLPERTARILLALGALIVAGGLAAVSVTEPTLLPLAGLLLTGAVVLSCCVLTRISDGDRSRRRRPYRAFMLTQYAVHLTAIAQCLAI
ncbi:4-hydroxybenzoate polyprenyltransferase/chlorophyll synthase [Micromonospora phaseoli]|uniref:4-hydroxybenzoate polyprenyltransferase/chlorophyll synthase n=1 Tax=Micromonospora phaseoli TaxID=1144548 RepID=A0A1H7B556_9ACTN|nr:UbiA family prenyltransferase [Micromonospora phaseoli]PZV96155.1 4-hydroxybenzoate polyprenyltransferase/chlorophyll synthase [Micromonospora phaseoli]GIJ79429.1 homogentisate phytyltransferase [Micromonospora phaseoli]SEJ69400.1 4-hydroxybenzoate polyprenyltransferase/chlorophyll synthase [Micromonospora phaseoli]